MLLQFRVRYEFILRLTTLDIYLASHILLLLDPPFPDQTLRSILEQSYLTLVEHARNVQEEVSWMPQYPIAPAQTHSLLSFIPRTLNNPIEKESQPDETDVRFRRMRWAWFALAFGGVAYYVVQLCMHTTIIRVDGKPRRVQKRGVDQEDETVIMDEEEGSDDEGVQDGG